MHSQSYSYMLDTICEPQERNEVLYQWKEDEHLLARNEFIRKSLIIAFQTRKEHGNAGEDDCGKLYFRRDLFLQRIYVLL